MTLRDPRLIVAFRLLTAVAVAAGVGCTAAGAATVTGLLPYFTIQSNLAYGAFAVWAAVRARRGELVTSAPLKGAVTLYVVITGLVYHLVLTNSASGFAMAAVQRDLTASVGNQLLHTVVPLLAVLDWLLFDTRGHYRWRYAVYWLAFPMAYLIFSLLRGLVVHRYPYPFIDAGELGYGGVAISTVFFTVTFWILGTIFVAIDRMLSGRLRRTPGASEPQTAAAQTPAARTPPGA
ncbi:MAG TPA: Pr6Pr family membrane protein [Actinoplanes sp.]|jgi:hypothetical protein